MSDIKVGDKVRSYDFEGNRNCYMEGIVVDNTKVVEGCTRYSIRVETEVFNGENRAGRLVGEIIFPPLNGTPTWYGRVTRGVEKV